MRLAQRLLLGALLLVGVLVLVVGVILDQRLYGRITEQNERDLASEARFVAALWRAGTDPVALADQAGTTLGHRVTLIDATGRVIGDSQFHGDALAGLENHSHRPEVMAAVAGGYGSSRRLSPSAGDEELYVAVRAPMGVARVSIATRLVSDAFDGARHDILAAGVIAVLVAALLATALARTFSRSIIELRDVARAMAQGDLTRRPALTAPGEVGDLATALHRMAEQLEARLSAIENEDAFLVTLFDSLDEGVVAVDQRRQVVRLNAAGRRLLGAREAVPFPADHLPRDRVLRDALAKALAGDAAEDLELTVGPRTLALTARPLERGGAVLAFLDLTPIRRLELVRRDFVANVSHELRTPLTIVGGFAETLANDDPPPEERRRFAETIRGNTRRMQRIVDDLLDLSRIESGGWVPAPRSTEIAGVAAEAMAPVREAAAARGVTLATAIAPDAKFVHADPTALRQILANLVENAVRHTPTGAVSVFSERESGGVNIGVRDTGIGISAEHLPRIFERFYRVDPGRSRGEGGTGLGLSIVRHLVDAHSGSVRAESTPGAGTTITTFFPDPVA